MATSGLGAWVVPKGGYRQTMTLPTDLYHLQRVRWSVIAVQRALIDQAYLSQPSRLDGAFGPMTAGAAAAFQKRNGLVADGWVGPATARRLFFRPVDDAQLARSIPDNLLYGMARLESGMDPGAEGKVDDRDRGLFQFNRTYWPSITDEVAYADVTHCAKVAADSLRLAYDRLGRWDCAVASHNNPSKARTWATTGSPPDDQIANYVTAVTINANLPR